jgi:enediyne biosynthesis protein E4
MHSRGALLFVAALAIGAASNPVPLRFDELARSAGLTTFQHAGGDSAKRYLVEAISGGVCAADFDDDGWVDLVFVNGGSFDTLSGRLRPPAHAVFRNRGDGTFEDVTARSRVTNAGWGMGCAVADYDGDNRLDLYLTYYWTPNQLWRNTGHFVFEDVTSASGTGGGAGRWNTGATFGDFDADGDLDLFVAGYVALDPARLPDPDTTEDCRHRGLVVHCGPRGLPGAGDLLFRNNGDGTFTEVGARLGVDPERHYGLGAVFLPLTPGEALALYVANDSTPNHLYRLRDGRLHEEALEAGAALSEEGQEQAGMGIAWGDYNGDGHLDLYVTNFVDDYNTLYRSLGNAFDDVTRPAGLAQPTWLYMGWGTAFGDFDRDGLEDLAVANGHIYPQVDTLKLPAGYRMPLQIFRNMGGGRFSELPREAAPGFTVGRGLALADFWNDGTLGFVVSNLDGQPQLFRPTGGAGRYVELMLDARGHRGAIGARVDVTWPGGRATRVVASGGSYLSSNDLRVHAGVGTAEHVEVTIRWPDGTRQQLERVATNRIYHLRQGERLTPR